jgi:hypothetical protein
MFGRRFKIGSPPRDAQGYKRASAMLACRQGLKPATIKVRERTLAPLDAQMSRFIDKGVVDRSLKNKLCRV